VKHTPPAVIRCTCTHRPVIAKQSDTHVLIRSGDAWWLVEGCLRLARCACKRVWQAMESEGRGLIDGPILCPVCRLKLGEIIKGEVVQVHVGRWSAGAHTIACDRKGCDGVWKREMVQ
jgi:hypothetical protein